MKKLLAILLTTVMCISICACSATNENSTMTKEELIQSATTLEVKDIFSAAENIVNAKEKYVGEYYEFSGFVDEISEECCSLYFVADNIDEEGYATIYLSKDDLSKIKTNERITVVGEISDISNENSFTMKTAYYIDNSVTLEAEVLSVIYESDILSNESYPSYCTARVQGFIDSKVVPLCDIYLSRNDLENLEEEDVITVKGNLYLYAENDRHEHYTLKILCEMKNAEIVSK